MIFRIADDLTISYDDFREEGLRIAILARSGGGKSNLAALFVEQAIEQGLQVCIIEPIEEWFTLRARYDNVVWIGEDGDIPLVPEMSSQYVELLKRGCNLVITAATGDEFVDKSFVGGFLWSLYTSWRAIRRPVLLVVEEADTYAPQMWGREDRPCLSRMALIAKRGRKLGINMIALSQRPADIHKSVISQANILFIGGFRSTQDLNAVKMLSKLMHLPLPTEDVASLSAGEFFAILRGEMRRIRAHFRKTPHGGVTPGPTQITRPDVKEAVESVRRIVEEGLERIREEQDIIKKLQRENEELRRRLEEYEEQLRTLRIVKEIPLELKVAPQAPEAPVNGAEVPEIVHRCPYPGALKVYQYLSSRSDYVKPKDVAAATGIGFNTVKRILRYFRKKGLVKVRQRHHAGKAYIKLVKLKRP